MWKFNADVCADDVSDDSNPPPLSLSLQSAALWSTNVAMSSSPSPVPVLIKDPPQT